MEALDEVGGEDEDAAVVNPPQSEGLAKQLGEAKAELLRDRPGLSAANLEAVRKKLAEANKALKDFSHGKLIKSIEDQQKTLKTELIALANMTATNEREQRNKAEFDNAVQTYLSKRIELARVRLQELAQEEKETVDARNYICSRFRTPDGRTGTGEVIANLGTEFSHIERSEGVFFDPLIPKRSVQVKYENGVWTSDSPVDFALALKGRGVNTFKFNKAKASRGGANVLIGSIEEMLKVGIKDISIDPKLMEKMLAPPSPAAHSAGDHAAKLAQFLKSPSLNVESYQKNRLKLLQRICAASSGAYNERKGNPVYDADGNMKTGKDVNPKPLQHQVDTFMRLTSDDDRREYLDILFPMNMAHHAAEFAEELDKRGVQFVGTRGQTTIFTRDLSPTEYFRQKMLRPTMQSDFLARRKQFDVEHDRITKLAKFNGYEFHLTSDLPTDGNAIVGKMYFAKDGDRLKYHVLSPNNQQIVDHLDINVGAGELTKAFLEANRATILTQTSTRGHTHQDTTEERTASYLEANDETLLRRYARSEKLNGPADNPNQLRTALVKSVFKDVQTPEAAGAPPNPRAISLYNRKFSSTYSVRADDQEAFLLKTLALFENIKVLKADKSIDFTRTAQAKTQLIQELRQQARDQFNREKAANIPTAFDNRFKNKILLDELEDRMLKKHFEQQKIEQRITPQQEAGKVDALLNQHLTQYNALNREEKAQAFINDFCPELQQRLWNQMDLTSDETIELRALILKKYIDLYEENPSPSALHFLNTSIAPLMKIMTRPLTHAELVIRGNAQRTAAGQPDKAAADWTEAELMPIHQAWLQDQRQGVTAMEAMTAKLRELCEASNIRGTKPTQNRALACIRDNIAALGKTYKSATAPLVSTTLFKEYFTDNPSTEKLLELLKCYADVRKELSAPKQWLLDRKFKVEMRELLFKSGVENALTGSIIESLYTRRADLCPNPEDRPTRHFIEALKELRDQIHAPSSHPLPEDELSPFTGPNAADDDERDDLSFSNDL